MTVASGGMAIHTQIDAGGSMSVQSGGAVSDVDLMSGGLLTFQSGATAAPGSLIVFHGAAVGGGPAGVVVAGGAGGAVLPNVTIQGFGAGDTIAVQDGDVGGPSSVAWTQTATNSGTLAVPYGATTYDFTLAGQYSPADFATTDDAVSGRTVVNGQPGNAQTTQIQAVSCFLAGTSIATPEGARSVETLAAGDLVLTLRADGMTVARPLVWAGSQVVRAAEHGHPVRIRAHAFADSVPARDLLVTPEHCIHHAGGFIPARMLVNGRSIVMDDTQGVYAVHHIETEQHAIVLSENLWTETFLDTGAGLGRRAGFTGQGQVAGRIAPVRSWAADAAVPLTVGRDQVEPLYRALEARAKNAGLVDRRVPAETTMDADLRLIADDGRVLPVLRRAGEVALFRLPAGVEQVWLASRADQPAAAIGPFVDDRRTLGVLVGAVTLWDSGETRTVRGHLDAVDGAGWLPREVADMRWTNGHARLDLGRRAPHSIGLVGVRIVAAGPYRCTVPTDLAQRA